MRRRAYYNDSYENYYRRYPTYNDDSYRPTHDTFVRTLIANLFSPRQAGYRTYAPAYQTYAPPVYSRYDNTPYYSPASYSPAYYDPYGGDGYSSPYYYGNNGLFGSNSLKGSLMNIGLSLLQGFLGQGYEQGLIQGQLARNVYGNRADEYYEPYFAAAQPAFSSPYASSLARERQIFDEGYRLGYEDAVRQQTPYYASSPRVDLISEFLTNTVLSQV